MKTESFLLQRCHRMLGCGAGFVTLMMSASAFACIGETEAQIEKRYGKPGEVDTKTPVGKVVTYQSNGCSINVVFVDGISQAENIRKDKGAPFSADEIKILLENNGAGRQWDQVREEDQSKQEWWRSDEEVHANYFRVDNRFFITSKKYETDLTEAAKRREKPTL
jgi:hypothetical protein